MPDNSSPASSVSPLPNTDECLQLVLESSRLGFWNWNLDTNRIQGNAFWRQLVGLEAPDGSLDAAEWQARIHPDQKPEVLKSLHDLLHNRKPVHEMTFAVCDTDGAYQTFFERARVTIRSQAGETAWVSGTMERYQPAKPAFSSIAEINPLSRADVHRARRDNQEIALLNWLVEMLQLCSTTDEAFEVLASTLKRLFPAANGLLAQPNSVPDQLQTVVQWGQISHKPIFYADECWALRRKFIHQVDDTNRQLICKHIFEPAPAASICIPMIVQEEIVGLFYLCHPTNPYFFDTTTMQLIQAIADSAAVAMDNINLRETLRQQSIRDPLTRLFNRRYMEETLERELKRADRAGYPVSVLMFDIDFFKQVNDLHGHQAGDVVLRDLGQLIMSNTRADDVACRYGGEEFLIILPNTNRLNVMRKAQRLCDLIKQMEWHFNPAQATHITVSLGISVYPTDGKSSKEITQVADAGLYRAKREGRDRIITIAND